MKRARKARWLTILLVAGVVLLGTVSVWAADPVHNVTQDTYYTSIQAAIDAASDGNTIHVAAGTYAETLNLKAKKLTIDGAGIGNTVINASSFSGYAISNFGDHTTFEGVTLIGSSHYGFKVSHVSDITLRNIRVQDSGRTGVDLNTVSGAKLTNVEVVNTAGGFGIMIFESSNVDVTDITTSGNSWGGVTVQLSDNDVGPVLFSGAFDASEATPLLLEKDSPYAGDFVDVTIPGRFNYVVYGERTGDNYKQWFYKRTLADAKTFANALVTSSSHTDLLIHDVAKENYYVIPGMYLQDAINDASSGDVVNVDPGTYKEQVGIYKSLDLLGFPGAVVLAPAGISGPTIRIAADGTTVSGLKISNAGNSGEIVGIFVGSNSPAYNDSAGQSIHLNNNTIDGINTTSGNLGVSGIQAKSYDSGTEIDGLNILDNLITNVSQPTWGANGIVLQADVRNVLIQGNTISNITGLWVWGVVLTPSAGESGFPSNVLVKKNVFYNLVGNYYPSVAIGVDAAVGGHLPDATQLTVRYNDLSGAAYGVVNMDPTANLDAALNWWGDVTGPSGEGSGIGNGVGPKVIFSPWLGTAPDGDPTQPGVQITGPMLIIVAPVGPEPTGGYLNAGIAGANSPDLPYADTIEVRPGTYDASATITDPVTIESQEGCPSTTFINGNLFFGSEGVQLGSLRHGFTIGGNLTVGAGINASQIHVNWNNIEGQVTNTAGIGSLDATYNFWGADGPLDNIAGQVHYYPYLPVEVCTVIQYMDDYGLNPNQAIVMAKKVLEHVNPKDILAAFSLVNVCGMSMDDALALVREYGRVKVQRALRLAHGDCAKLYTQLVGYGVAGGAGGGLLDKQIVGGGGAIEGVPLQASYTQGDTIHIAFTLTDPITGDVVTDAVATLSVVRVDPTELAFWGMIPYDSVSGQYQLDYATSGLTPGYYDLYIGTSDGQTKQLRVEIVAP